MLAGEHAGAGLGLEEEKRGKQVKKHEVEGAVGSEEKKGGRRWDAPRRWQRALWDW